MAKPPKLLASGIPDGRGQSAGSRASRFSGDRPGPGRPKGAKNIATIYREVAALPVTATINDRQRRISTVEAVLRKQREKALKGDQRAAERFLDKVAEYSPPEIRPDQMPALLEEDARLLADALARGLLGPAIINPTPNPEEDE
ncbi:DUF5681 domain-containing protein [Sphingomonas profundi]|uniref:DUF5681 domain-containing protein n=1 Tax=Alterirhizorhabdus profundi TaxID=2681549 RepID=UPI0012E97048|nr:DUF5681 domain-containing protein [Sphingomonas profundi]